MSDIVKANQKLLTSNKLPPCKGPKLHAFRDSSSPITFLELLERAEPYEDSGFQAYVFKVSIKSRIYALKVVIYTINSSWAKTSLLSTVLVQIL